MNEEQGQTWLSPQQVSKILGVHPTTLRVWSNKGMLPAYRTAGGHRRFLEADVARFLQQSRQQQADSNISHVVETTLALARRQASQELFSHERWYGGTDEAARSRHRELGRQLLGADVQRHAGLADTGHTQASHIRRVSAGRQGGGQGLRHRFPQGAWMLLGLAQPSGCRGCRRAGPGDATSIGSVGGRLDVGRADVQADEKRHT